MSTGYIIDCDTGRDDALALWLAQRRLDLAGVVASYGNVSQPQVHLNTAAILAYSGHRVPVLMRGADGPDCHHPLYERIVLPRQRNSGNGLCNLEFSPPAAMPEDEDLLHGLQRLVQDRGRLHYLITGPATRFARLCRELGESVHDYVAGVTMMGGKFALWAEQPGPDFNIAADPFAIRDILASGLPVCFVPMDATWPIVMSLTEIEALNAGDDTARAARALMIAHCRHFAPEPVFRFHDPSLIFALDDAAYYARMTLGIDCDPESTDFGRLFEDEDKGMPAYIYRPDETRREAILEAILAHLGLSR